jgi:hypothetical protein
LRSGRPDVCGRFSDGGASAAAQSRARTGRRQNRHPLENKRKVRCRSARLPATHLSVQPLAAIAHGNSKKASA